MSPAKRSPLMLSALLLAFAFLPVPGFCVFAHELAHLLGNLPHVDYAPNLMTNADGAGAKSGDLTEEQCTEILKLYGL